MTTFEFFKADLEKSIADGYGTTVYIRIRKTPGSYEWLHKAWEFFCGGAFGYQVKEVTDPQEMVEAKYLRYHYYTNWEARRRGQTERYTLTIKGIREFYKRYGCPMPATA